MSNELKVGDVVMINGEEYELQLSTGLCNRNSPYLKRFLKKSELEKFINAYCDRFGIKGDDIEGDLIQPALALLKFIHGISDDASAAFVKMQASKWCGK